MKKVIIAAVAENNVIGTSSGEMPWHSKEEFQHFRNTTLGFPIIMGRKTFESLQKPLQGRLNIIISRNTKLKDAFPGILVFNSIPETYEYCRQQNYDKIFIIGGGDIFKNAISDADEMIISKMQFEAKGDVYFPEINESEWKICKTDQRSEFRILYYFRKDYEC